MPDRWLDAKSLESPDAASAQHKLLVEAHLAAADVQDVSDWPIGLGVVGDVRVEEKYRHATDLDQPHGGVKVPLRQFDRDGQRFAILAKYAQDRQLGEVVVGVGVFLVAVGIDRLAEIAVLVQQPHAD